MEEVVDGADEGVVLRRNRLLEVGFREEGLDVGAPRGEHVVADDDVVVLGEGFGDGLGGEEGVDGEP